MSDKRYPTRMHEVLGMETGEQFEIPNYAGEVYVDSYGYLLSVSEIDFVPGPRVCEAINHPERIIRRPRQEDDDANKGLYSKYKVTKADGTPLDGDCFVLRPDRDEAAISALEAYADATNNEKLAADIREWLQTTRRPRLTEEQVAQLKALHTLGYRWLTKDKWKGVSAFICKPFKGEHGGEWMRYDPMLVDDGYIVFNGYTQITDLVSWSDPEPLDIVQVLRENGVEVEVE